MYATEVLSMEENMILDHGLPCDFIDFMGVGAQHEDDEISPVEDELDPEQENMNLDRGSRHSFIDFMGLGADFMDLGVQHDDDIDDPLELDPAPENMNLDLGLTPYSFIDFMGLSAQHGDDIDIDIDDLIPQEPDPAQMHHHQRDSTRSDVSDALPLDRVYRLMELLPTGKVERNTPEDRTVRLDLDMRLIPNSSIRLLRQEGSQFLTLHLGPTLDAASDPTSEPAFDVTFDPVTSDLVTAEGRAAWTDQHSASIVEFYPHENLDQYNLLNSCEFRFRLFGKEIVTSVAQRHNNSEK